MTGQSTLGIGVTMFLRDQFSGPSANIRKSAAMTAADLRKVQEEQLRYQRNLYAGLAMAGAAATRQIGKSITRGAEFGYEMEFVRSITKATRGEAKELGSLAKQLGQDTMFFSQDVAEGMRFMGMAGMGAKEIRANIGAAVTLAGSTKSQIGGKGGASDIMTNIMKAFQIDSQHSAKVADILSYATTRANTNLFDLGEALKYAGSTAMDLQIPLQEATAMTMALGNAGMQGSMAGVAMENAMRYLARATGAFGSGTQKKALADIGLSKDDITDAKGNLLSMTEVIKATGYAIDRTFGPGNNIEKQGVLQTLFGVRGKRAGSLLIRNFKEFDTFVKDIATESGGHASRIMGNMMETVQGYLWRAKSIAQNLSIVFADTLAPTVKSLLWMFEGLVKVAQKLMGSKFGNFLGPAIAGWVTVKAVAWAAKAVYSGIKLIQMQLAGSMSVLTSRSVSGWNAQTAAARRYNNTILQTRFATGASVQGAVRRNAAGSMIRSHTSGFGRKGQLISAGLASRYASRYRGKLLGTGLATGARVMAGKAIGPAIARIAGVLTGPLGMVLSFVLPGLIGMGIRAIRSNKEATEKATEATRDNMKLVSTGRLAAVQHLTNNAQRLVSSRDLVGGRAMSPNDLTPEGYAEMQKRFTNNTNQTPQVVNHIKLYLDGEEITDKTLEKVESSLRRGYHNTGME